MWSEDDFQYAIENTEVILAPQSRIATFGQTSFRFYLISELMDRVNEVRVRDGRSHAERPQIVTPDHYARLLLEGFGEKAQRFAERLRGHPPDARNGLTGVVSLLDGTLRGAARQRCAEDRNCLQRDTDCTWGVAFGYLTHPTAMDVSVTSQPAWSRVTGTASNATVKRG